MTTVTLASGSDIGAAIGGAAIYVAVVLGYFLPSLVGSRRRVPNLSAVVVVNVLLGWTFIGWVIALAMALSGPSRRPRRLNR